MRRREFITNLLFSAVTPHVQAQQPAKVYRLAIVSLSRPVTRMNETSCILAFKALFDELRRLHYVEGQNLIVERYSGEGNTAHYAELAREVVRQKPDVIFADSTRMVRYLKAVTTTILIVGNMNDPIARGLVDRLGATERKHNRSWRRYGGKRLGLLRELISAASRMGFLYIFPLFSRGVAGSPQGAGSPEGRVSRTNFHGTARSTTKHLLWCSARSGPAVRDNLVGLALEGAI
jgi:putative ABC transport system substrate-binding protein